MHNSFRILFYENGDPVSPRCIERILWTFPKSYREVVEPIIEESESLNKEVFRRNVARLMPSFKMTRAGAFRGVRYENGIVMDPNDVISSCWKQIGTELRKLKEYINEEVRDRNRALVTTSLSSEKYVIEEISKLFRKLRKIEVKTSKLRTSQVSPVGASKVLFATIPEIALPVDRTEWKYVFKTKEYQEILSTMVNEIKEWERKTNGRRLETLDPSYPKATLPGVYNIMAMSVRDMLRTAKR